MESNDQEIGLRIKKIRKEKGLTLKEFGKMVDAPFSAVSNWENGRNKPNNERLRSIAELGSISVEELLYGDFKARIKKILLDEPKVNENYVEFVMNYFINTNNRYATEEDILKKYDEIAISIDSTVEKNIAQKMLAYNIRHSEELLFDYLKDSSSDLDYSNIKLAINELANAAGNYETCFDRTVDEVYNEVITIQQQEK